MDPLTRVATVAVEINALRGQAPQVAYTVSATVATAPPLVAQVALPNRTALPVASHVPGAGVATPAMGTSSAPLLRLREHETTVVPPPLGRTLPEADGTKSLFCRPAQRLVPQWGPRAVVLLPEAAGAKHARSTPLAPDDDARAVSRHPDTATTAV